MCVVGGGGGWVGVELVCVGGGGRVSVLVKGMYVQEPPFMQRSNKTAQELSENITEVE